MVAATGFLFQPRTPDIPGIETFSGRNIHTAAWDDDYAPGGRRTAVIGTGSTGWQVIPELAKEVSELTVYQRTPIWVLPKSNIVFPPAVQRLFAKVPVIQRIVRWFTDTGTDFMMVITMWKYRRFKLVNRAMLELSKIHRLLSVRDRDLARKLNPDFDFGCKLPTLSNSCYSAFTKPHVHLETSGIERIEPDGIVARGTKRFVDTLVLATGFDVWHANLPAIEVIGREGRNLGKWWREISFQAYEGISVPHLPNFLTMASPFAWVGLSWFSWVKYQMRHMDRLFRELQRRGARTFAVTEAANARFPRADGRFGVSPRQLRNLAVVLVQEPHRQRGSTAFPADVGAQRRQRTGPIPADGLLDSVRSVGISAGSALAGGGAGFLRHGMTSGHIPVAAWFARQCWPCAYRETARRGGPACSSSNG